MGGFAPEFEGELSFDPLPDDCIERIRQRVESGLLQPGRRDRADYRVTSMDRDAIRFEAHGFLTFYNVGLNDVSVQRSGRDRLRYHVTYWRWTVSAVVHSLALGALLAGLYLMVPQMRADVAAHPHGIATFATIVGFFSLAWPWLLTMGHRRFAEQCLQRVLRESMSGATARAA